MCLVWKIIMQSAILGKLLHTLKWCQHTHIDWCRGLEEFDGNYDSDEDADFTKMDMVVKVNVLSFRLNFFFCYRVTRRVQSNAGISRMRKITANINPREKPSLSNGFT